MSESIDFAARVRLDKWLWAARFYKTRTLATRSVEAGHVLLNGAPAKPARDVRIDDLVSISQHGTRWIVRVRIVSDSRVAAGLAQTRYAETEESIQARLMEQDRRRLYREPAAGQARPGKKERRQLSKVRQR